MGATTKMRGDIEHAFHELLVDAMCSLSYCVEVGTRYHQSFRHPSRCRFPYNDQEYQNQNHCSHFIQKDYACSKASTRTIEVTTSYR